jgi:hypothetical protein
MLTTGAMVRIGKTYGNLMVDVHTGSEKLKDRARRIVNIVTGVDYEEADRLLKKAHWNVKAAIVMQKTALPYPKALTRLRKAHDSMRQAIGEDIEPRLRGMLQGHAEAAGTGAPESTAPRSPEAPPLPPARKTAPPQRQEPVSRRGLAAPPTANPPRRDQGTTRRAGGSARTTREDE